MTNIKNVCEAGTVREITHLVVHCSATREGQVFRAKDIKRWHTDPEPHGRGWKDIGYHYVIGIDGLLEKGRKDEVIGSHASGHNATTIGICYVGGMSADGKKAKNTLTPAQENTLHALIHDLQHKYPDAKLLGHRDFRNVNKECPSFDVRAWWAKQDDIKDT